MKVRSRGLFHGTIPDITMRFWGKPWRNWVKQRAPCGCSNRLQSSTHDEVGSPVSTLHILSLSLSLILRMVCSPLYLVSFVFLCFLPSFVDPYTSMPPFSILLYFFSSFFLVHYFASYLRCLKGLPAVGKEHQPHRCIQIVSTRKQVKAEKQSVIFILKCWRTRHLLLFINFVVNLNKTTWIFWVLPMSEFKIDWLFLTRNFTFQHPLRKNKSNNRKTLALGNSSHQGLPCLYTRTGGPIERAQRKPRAVGSLCYRYDSKYRYEMDDKVGYMTVRFDHIKRKECRNKERQQEIMEEK